MKRKRKQKPDPIVIIKKKPAAKKSKAPAPAPAKQPTNEKPAKPMPPPTPKPPERQITPFEQDVRAIIKLIRSDVRAMLPAQYPFQIHIHVDILNRLKSTMDLPYGNTKIRVAISRVLRPITKSRKYQAVVRTSPHRYGLNGKMMENGPW